VQQEPKDLLLLEEISHVSRVPLETLRWFRKNNRGPRTFRLGGRVVAFRADVDAWILEQMRKEHGDLGGNEVVAEASRGGHA
jgi:predicted DNA-binding transcriptional regulator AlpA